MNWDALLKPIDAYCERTDASFWAEPLNAITNAAFVIAAYFLLRLWRSQPNKPWPLTAMIICIAVIGAGSFLFHTHANTWSMLADVIPITVFMYLCLGTYMRAVIGLGWHWVILGFGAFGLAGYVSSAYLAAEWLNGSESYLPAWLSIWLIALSLRGQQAARWVALSGLAFTVSLTARSLDMQVCEAFPVGVHFLWHLLNAVVLYALCRGVMVGYRR